MKQKGQSYIITLHIWRLYLVFSFAASLMIFFADIILHGVDRVAFFSISLVVVSYFYYIFGGVTEGAKKSNTLFSAQIIILIGMGFEKDILGPIFISIVPIVFGVSYYLLVGPTARERLSDYKKKAFFPFLVALGAYVTGFGITNSSPLAVSDFFLFTFFVWWTGSICYYSGGLVRRKQRGAVLSELEDKDIKSISEVCSERMFFHDIINSTHGISLFLTNRVNSGNSVTSNECLRINDEIKLLQSMIKDHFGMIHQNLDEIKNYVSLASIKDQLVGYIRNYLPETEVDCRITFNGNIESDYHSNVPSNVLVDYPAFYRILVNLVKNIREEGSTIATFDISTTQDMLYLETKNKVFKLSKDEENMVSNLRDMIIGKLGVDYQSKKNDRGVGLESIMTICLSRGGSFDFGLEGEYWVNKVTLPIKKELIKDDRFKENLKKAA